MGPVQPAGERLASPRRACVWRSLCNFENCKLQLVITLPKCRAVLCTKLIVFLVLSSESRSKLWPSTGEKEKGRPWPVLMGKDEQGESKHSCFSGDHLSPAPSTPLSLFRAQFMDFPRCRNLDNVSCTLVKWEDAWKFWKLQVVLRIVGIFYKCWRLFILSPLNKHLLKEANRIFLFSVIPMSVYNILY